MSNERIYDLNQIGGLQEENARLKAEVERLTDAITRGAITPDAKPVNANLRKNADISPSQSPHEIERLKAEVKRLQVELADAQESYHLVNERVARILKQGKQS